MAASIPKRVIQTSKSANLPPLSQASAVNIQLLNPDFEYLFFDDEQIEAFIAAQPARYRDAFHAFPLPIQRFDFFRYLAVYHYGGFYFDMDVVLCRPLADLLNTECVFPFEALSLNGFYDRYGMDWEIGNYAFGAAAGHPFLRAVIDNCIKSLEDKAWAAELVRPIPAFFRHEFSVLCTTGPGVVTRTLAEYDEPQMPVHVLFPDDVRHPRNWNQFGDYGIHLLEGTWRNRKRVVRRRLFAIWRDWQRRTRAKSSQQRGPHRSMPVREGVRTP